MDTSHDDIVPSSEMEKNGYDREDPSKNEHVNFESMTVMMVLMLVSQETHGQPRLEKNRKRKEHMVRNLIDEHAYARNS